MNKYKYIVVPKDTYSNEIISKRLLEVCTLDGNEAIFFDKKAEKRGYFIRHDFVTTLKNCRDLNLKYLLYSQEGEGAIRRYCIPGKKKSEHQKKIIKQLREIRSAKKPG